MSPLPLRTMKKWHMRLATATLLIVAVFAVYSFAYAERVVPRVSIGGLSVGGMTRDQAEGVVQERLEYLQEYGITINVEGVPQVIRLENINFSFHPEEIVNQAWQIGRQGTWYEKIGQQLTASIVGARVVPRFSYDQEALLDELDIAGNAVGQPSDDVHLVIRGTRVDISYKTQSGMVLDKLFTQQAIVEALKNFDIKEISVPLRPEVPHIRAASAPEAKRQADAMMRRSLTLTHDWQTFVISREQIGQWILSGEQNGDLKPMLDEVAISRYITTIANALNIAAQKPTVNVVEGKVTEFVPPRAGKALQENETRTLIMSELEARRDGKHVVATAALPVKVTKPTFESTQAVQISELIGKATTPFTGSPANRVSNIKNGTKFLSGVLIPPGEEFSTLKTLGTVDNTTGYLPELVIKESQTVPEFGGGLCQVSTTLFRAALNAGLPITERRNHSFRVSYYEKDATGKSIGPGLDATIYDNSPDFKFRNDTGFPILVYGYVEKDRLTFELYGTSDGRTASVVGPTLLTEIPPGEPIYHDTDQLPKGVVKQKEFARPGGTTSATYTISYPDGRQVKQEFKSFYRRWPAQYLVGTGVATSQ